MKAFFMNVILLFIMVGCARGPEFTKVQRRELLRDYFLSSCVTQVFKNDSILNYQSEKDRFDHAGYSVNRFSEVDDLAKAFVDSIQPSIIDDHGGKKSIILDCIEKYKSQATNKMIQALLHGQEKPEDSNKKPTDKETHVRGVKYTNKQKAALLKDYFFTSCIIQAFRDYSIRDDISRGVYFDISGYGIEALGKVDSLAKVVIDSVRSSQMAPPLYKDFVIFNCLEKYKEKQMKRTIKTFDAYIY